VVFESQRVGERPFESTAQPHLVLKLISKQRHSNV